MERNDYSRLSIGLRDEREERLLYVSVNSAATGSNLAEPEAPLQKTCLGTRLTLRACNSDHRRETKTRRSSPLPPEFDNNDVVGKVAPLLEFDNRFGHVVEGSTIVFEPTSHRTLRGMAEFLRGKFSKSLSLNRAWDLEGTVVVGRNSSYDYNEDFKHCFDVQDERCFYPVSFHPPVATLESVEARGKDRTIFSTPSQSTAVNGPLGAIANNTSVEMKIGEEDGVPSIELRSYNRDKYEWFVCKRYNAHSGDAGKSRRLVDPSRIRVSTRNPLGPAVECCGAEEEDGGDWIVYCMGQTVRVGVDTVKKLTAVMRARLSAYYRSQFNYPNITEMAAPPTFTVWEKESILHISVAPGAVLAFSEMEGVMADSCMVHHQVHCSMARPINMRASSWEDISAGSNLYWKLIPFAGLNRAPREMFAASQTTQAVTAPWAPATARMSPCYVSTPLASTEFVREMEQDQRENPAAIWDNLPGSNLVVCYLNLKENYEDSMIISSRVADMGCFSTMSVCTFRLNEKDKIPKVGERLCGKEYHWWKSGCNNSCKCNKKGTSDPRAMSVGRYPTGFVTVVDRTSDGGLSIKVESFSQFMPGDKCSTLHGQKGVSPSVAWMDPADLPVIHKKGMEPMTADIYISASAMVSRGTNGQAYESGVSWRACDGCRRTCGGPQCKSGVVVDLSDMETETCDYVTDGRTGLPMTTWVKEKIGGRYKVSRKLTRATFGFQWVVHQTQATREKHHFTHSSEPLGSLGTKSGRSAGGGVASAEMDSQAMTSSGLSACAGEIFNRGSVTRSALCTNCGRWQEVHDCGESGYMVRARGTTGVKSFDQISACVSGNANTYRVEHV